MLCPYCNHGIRFEVQDGNEFMILARSDFESTSEGYRIIGGYCPLCDELIILWQKGTLDSYDVKSETFYEMQEVEQETIIFPKNYLRPVDNEIPEIYKVDFLEACAVLSISPKASAAISRRLLQNILREDFKISHRDLYQEIDEFIKTKHAPSHLNDEIDAIRNVGNFAAHPLKSTSTGLIVDVEPGEAEWLIEVLESLFDFAFVQPEKAKQRRQKLNAKLQDIGKPPMKKS